MKSPALRALALAFLFLASAIASIRADPLVPRSLMEPKNAPEAWNVIRLATTNVDRLLAEDRVAEIPVQLSFIAPAVRTLMRSAATPEAIAATELQGERAIGWLTVIARAAEEKNGPSAKDNYGKLRFLLDDMARHFDQKDVRADIYFCPMHTDFTAQDPKTPCGKCAMDLHLRRLPYSFIYTKPGEPSIRLIASPSGPVEAGKKLDVTVRLERSDKSPVKRGDLIAMDTEPIHLLIEEPGLADYHHEHPKPTKTPGEYAFSFTPRKSAPYRIWADIVPVATGVQELPSTDLPSEGKSDAIESTATQMESQVDDFHFKLDLSGGNDTPLKAQNARKLTVTITNSAGAPVNALEPVMHRFARLAGFYGDRQTIVQFHPSGGDALSSEARGGPTLSFVFFPPKPGFIRLYCEVSIAGKMRFAPLNVNVVE